jgi:hypothetical protein
MSDYASTARLIDDGGWILGVLDGPPHHPVAGDVLAVASMAKCRSLALAQRRCYVCAMAALPQRKMTVDEYLAWAEGQPGRFELYVGTVYAMTPERAEHATVKLACKLRCCPGFGELAFLATCYRMG